MGNRFTKLLVFYFVSLTLGMLGILIIASFITTPVIETYSELSIELPILTKLFINLYMVFIRSWFVIILCLLVGVLGISASMAYILRNTDGRKLLVWSIAVFLILFGLIMGFITFGICLPVFSLTGDVSYIRLL